MFLKDQWYVAAWSEDLGRELIARILQGEDVVLYRRQDGSPVALENRCPHRNLPLSEGQLNGDSIACGYHGLVFDCNGECTHVPGQAEVPEWARVRRYPIVERDRRVFVWMGDPAVADVATVPDYHRQIDDPDWHFVTGQAHVRAGYRLVLDNLLDLSHLSYVHASTTGNPEVAEKADIITEADGDFVRVTRWMEAIPAAPAYVFYSGKDDPIDRWQVSRYLVPSCIDITNGSTAAGEGLPQTERPRSCGRWGFVVQHAMTPESEATTHQFWAVGVEKRLMHESKFAAFDEAMRDVIIEDLVVYEAQQRAIDLDKEAIGSDANPKGTLPIDEGLLAMRRIIRRLYGDEQKRRDVA
jgi:vanillate O-demethylase monooxygenase subunit